MGTSRIGIGVPCHIRDKEMLEKYTLPAINRLNPPPDEIFIFLNNGVSGGLLEIRDRIFHELFINRNCDVVFVTDVDFYLFDKTILNKVRSDMVVTFARIFKLPVCAIIITIHNNVTRKSWCGCYSMPKQIYYKYVKGKWSGLDSDIHKCINNNFESTRKPRVMAIGRDIKKLKEMAVHGNYSMIERIMRLSRLLPI